MKSEIEKDPFQAAAPREARRKRTGGENLAQEASEYIEAHFREKFSLQKMADSLYINGSYLENEKICKWFRYQQIKS